MAERGSSSASRIRSLNREGSAYLANYARTINAYPRREEKQQILKAIQHIPGNEMFTLAKLNNWFARYRATSHDAHTRVLLDDETILFPKLTPTHLQQLRVLYKKLNEPAEGVVTFWAKRISADRAEVAAWIEYQQEKAKDNGVAESPVSPIAPEFTRPHLPTPAKSLSPQTKMPSLPPIAIKVEPKQCLSPVSSLSTPCLGTRQLGAYMSPTETRSVLEGLPPLSRQVPGQTRPPEHGGQPNVTLVDSIKKSLRSDTNHTGLPPRTADEFAEKFGQVENMIDTFMKKYQSGQLVQLGWDSSLGSSTS